MLMCAREHESIAHALTPTARPTIYRSFFLFFKIKPQNNTVYKYKIIPPPTHPSPSSSHFEKTTYMIYTKTKKTPPAVASHQHQPRALGPT